MKRGKTSEEDMAIRLEAIVASRLEAIATRVDTIASRLEAITIGRTPQPGLWSSLPRIPPLGRRTGGAAAEKGPSSRTPEWQSLWFWGFFGHAFCLPRSIYI